MISKDLLRYLEIIKQDFRRFVEIVKLNNIDYLKNLANLLDSNEGKNKKSYLN
ncbi:MAG: hypothetical protein ACP5G1_02010 [Nanopusillaceae archaeon]